MRCSSKGVRARVSDLERRFEAHLRHKRCTVGGASFKPTGLNPRHERAAFADTINARLQVSDRASWEIFGTDWREIAPWYQRAWWWLRRRLRAMRGSCS
jgi:hypothetical protein